MMEVRIQLIHTIRGPPLLYAMEKPPTCQADHGTAELTGGLGREATSVNACTNGPCVMYFSTPSLPARCAEKVAHATTCILIHA